jgi:phospholipase B1
MYYSKIKILFCLVAIGVLVVGQPLFDCPPLPPRNISTSIFNLYPSDVKIMMAMGDSITAAFGIMGSLNESRGYSFSMGGASGIVTLPNLFMQFNPNVTGYSIGTYPAEACYGPDCPELQFYPYQDANNAAMSGSLVIDMLILQANYLIRQINVQSNMDVKNDWKVLSIMIGVDDLCASCTYNLTYLSADDYMNNLMGTLERIRTTLPRTFVNLVSGFNVSQAYDLSLTISHCVNVTRPFFIQCDCLFHPANGYMREIIDSRITEYNQRAVTLAQYYQLKAYSDFAVVVQPFATNTYIDELPSGFLSHLDCFHPSARGQEAMAIALWNNMLTPSALKQNYLDMTDTPICPTDDTLLYIY